MGLRDKSYECRSGSKGEEKAKYKSPPVNPKTNAPPKAAESANVVQAQPSLSKEMSQQQIKSMLADAAQIIHQAAGSPQARSNAETAAVPMSPPCAPPTVVTQTGTHGARDQMWSHQARPSLWQP